MIHKLIVMIDDEWLDSREKIDRLAVDVAGALARMYDVVQVQLVQPE